MTTPELKKLFAGTAQEKNGDGDYLTIDDDENAAKTAQAQRLANMREDMAKSRSEAVRARDVEGVDELIAASHYRPSVEALILELKPLMQKIGWAKKRLYEDDFGQITINPPSRFRQIIELNQHNFDADRSRLSSRTENLHGLYSLVELDFPMQQTFTIALKDGRIEHETVTRNISIRTLTAMHVAIVESMQRMGFGIDVTDRGGENAGGPL